MRKRRIRVLVQQAGAAFFVVLVYIYFAGTLGLADVLNVALILAGTSSLAALLARRVLPAIRRWRFPVFVLLTATLYTVGALAVCAVEIWAYRSIDRHLHLFDPALLSGLAHDATSPFFIRGFLLAFAVFFAIAFVSEVSRKLGPGVLRNWLLGRYRNPLIEQRVFMFLDLKDSTALAERIGDIDFSRFLQEFFGALTEPILNSRGEVSHYIGDEVVISWPLAEGLRDAACIECFRECKDQIERGRLHFLATYGVVPAFKAALHCGSVVAAEVGDIKSEVVYHGDVLNTTSRIQELCRGEGYDLLLSRVLADQLTFDLIASPVALGTRAVKGKDAPLELVGLWAVDSLVSDEGIGAKGTGGLG